MSLIFRYSCMLHKSQRKIIQTSINCNHRRHYENQVKIGNVSKSVHDSKNPHIVPVNYLPKNLTQNITCYLQWIMKKDILGQDIFLIGLPGPLRGRIILKYLELMQREVEYVVLSRDTTENDLKQRREICNGTAHYVDQSAVKAAIEGRFLILDGIEKVERNVLPVLNNLLENREMQLEDGRFLLSAERYDKLLLEHSEQKLKEWKLVRVSENFRVVALGLPVPPFKGNPLDPPFRSRFQAQHIQQSFEDLFSEFSSTDTHLPKQMLKNFLSACYSLLSNESATLGIPKFPIENLPNALKILHTFHTVPLEHVFRWMFPYSLILSKEVQKSVLHTLKIFSIEPKSFTSDFEVLNNNVSESESLTHFFELIVKGRKISSDILGHKPCNKNKMLSNFVPNLYHKNILTDMMITHTTHDFCIIGNKGSGKSILAKSFASLLNYPIEIVMLYADMTARDLLQQRITDEHGNTLWRSSRLIHAAIKGKLLILDGLHRLHSSTLSVLQRLIHNRELQLYDDTRLLRHDRYDLIQQKHGFSDAEMKAKNILRIHPSFRIVALAEPPKLNSSKDQWITPELMSMFLFHSVRPLHLKEENLVIQQLVGKTNEKMDMILNFAHVLRNSEDEALQNVSASFSTRQLVRMARRLSAFPEESIYTLVTQACLMKFLPQLTKQAVQNVLESCGIKETETACKNKKIHVTGGKLFIGNTCAPVYKTSSGKIKVPDILFYDNQEHLNVMEGMLQDFQLGEHLLLVGNQGVGKNKITDRFLQLLNRPREYIQLHRDTTVQSLTQQPTVIDGRIFYEDSPLLKAVQHGHVLVVDEADKAPTHVTCILKALVESGEMVLSDGRCIVHSSDFNSKSNSNIVMHPDFRMIVLANRPGFPFLGNDFFSTLGDIFSCHAVDNPTLESEIAMLRQYGPNVPEHMLRRLTKLFGDLRSMSDAGLISYPYSTREIVNIIKHLSKFPDENVSFVLKNVFDFDSFSTEVKETISSLFEKYGIPNINEIFQVNTATSHHLPKPYLKMEWKINSGKDIWMPKIQELRFTGTQAFTVKKQNISISEARSNIFSEQQSFFQISLSNTDIPLDISCAQIQNDDIIYVATANPLSLHAVNQEKMLLSSINISGYFPPIKSGFRPIVKIFPIGSTNERFIFLHESTSNQSFVINMLDGLVSRINITSVIENTFSKLSDVIYSKSVNKNFYSCVDFPSREKLLMYRKNGNRLLTLDFVNSSIFDLELPQNIYNVFAVSENCLVLAGDEKHNFIADISNPEKWIIRDFNYDSNSTFESCSDIKLIEVEDSLQKINYLTNKKQVALMSDMNDYATIVDGSITKDDSLKVYSFSRNNPISLEGKSCILPISSQIIRFLQPNEVPSNMKMDSENARTGYLEVIDMKSLTYCFLPIKLPYVTSSYTKWLSNTSKDYIVMCSSSSEELITADASGCIRKWETNKQLLHNSFLEWKKLSGTESKEQLTIEHINPNSVTEPKHGKIDPTGAPHVGGNTWAGGTGGRDTAGLGGKGGPYRLDAGHTVYQLSDREKDSVPAEVKEAARKMARKAYQDKLKEIDMSEYDANLYENFSSSVRKQVNMLRVILDGLQAKSKERRWVRHQTSGELDDYKLIESITGEKTIYKKRGEQDPEIGSPQEKPKLLKLVVDVSGSMYRFNGHDNRLQRELESLVLVMEAFDGYDDKFQYEIIGHSGEDFCIEFIKFGKTPKNNKERLNILKKMYSHSQFCMSGDNTLPATEHAIKTITKDEADEYFVIILSDANFDRYGISPASFGNLLVSDPKVNAFAIFIGSLGDQANILSKQLPPGRGFICFDSSNLTQILQKIFTSALLRD